MHQNSNSGSIWAVGYCLCKREKNFPGPPALSETSSRILNSVGGKRQVYLIPGFSGNASITLEVQCLLWVSER